jgi:glutathione S-transferase
VSAALPKGFAVMMILRSAPPSPFGRKVKIAAALLGLTDEIRIVTADTNDPRDPLRSDNPLGKIPALVLEDGAVVHDSAVIVEYLDMRAGGGRLIPKGGMERIRALTMQSLADGLMDAAILQVYETRWRESERREAKWLDHQSGKVERALTWLEANAPDISGDLNVGHVAVAAALGYLDLRFKGEWRPVYPRLVNWLDAFAAKVPAFEATRAPG